MNVLGMCLNPRVLAGLALVGLAVWVVAPGAILAVLPLLVLAICPLSMILMGKMMMGGSKASNETQDPAAKLAALEREQEKLRLDIARTRAEAASAAQKPVALPTPSKPRD